MLSVLIQHLQDGNGEWAWWEKDLHQENLWWWVKNGSWHRFKVHVNDDYGPTGGGWMAKALALCHMHYKKENECLKYSLEKLACHPSITKCWNKIQAGYDVKGMKIYGQYI